MASARPRRRPARTFRPPEQTGRIPRMTGTELTSAPSRNGHVESEVEDPGRARSGALIGRLARGLAAQVQQRIPRADLDERDPDFIRENLPLMWLAASIY